MFQGRWYDEVALGSGLFGDFNPLHVDEEFSKKSMFGTGMYFSRTALAYLEHRCRFTAPASACFRASRATSGRKSPSRPKARSWWPLG